MTKVSFNDNEELVKIEDLDYTQASDLIKELLAQVYRKLRDEGFGYSIDCVVVMDSNHPELRFYNALESSGNTWTDMRD